MVDYLLDGFLLKLRRSSSVVGSLNLKIEGKPEKTPLEVRDASALKHATMNLPPKTPELCLEGFSYLLL